MTLAQFENYILATLQQQGSNFTGSPNWASLNNPPYPQAMVDFWINQGYIRLLSDTTDFQLTVVQQTFLSTALTNSYALPAAGLAPMRQLTYIAYQPVGLTYSREFRPGRELVSWMEFQRYTGQGYLNPYAYGTQPSFASIDPTRKRIFFYPGSANANDVITYQYVPIPTSGSSNAPLLVAESDTPLTPADCDEAIAQWALANLWQRANEPQQAQLCRKAYQEEIARIRANYIKFSKGDTVRVEPFVDDLSNSTGVW